LKTYEDPSFVLKIASIDASPQREVSPEPPEPGSGCPEPPG